MTHPTEHAVAYLMVVSAPWKHYRCTMVAMGQSMGYTMIHTTGKNHAGPRQTLVVLVRWDTHPMECATWHNPREEHSSWNCPWGAQWGEPHGVHHVYDGVRARFSVGHTAERAVE